MQTILGSTGVIGKQLALNLASFTDHIRLVSRNPKKVNQNDETLAAELLNGEQTMKAVEGSEVVYLVAGLPYNVKTWKEQWPVVMGNVVNACIKHKAKLVFFDNVYCYGRVNGWMTEDTPVQPSSKKGAVRADIVGMIMHQVGKGNLNALIARAADFYGPHTPLSFVNVLVFENLKKGKKAQWMIKDNVKHTFTYTPDAGKATAILGNTDHAYNQVWHLPTDRNALTGKEFIQQAAQEFGVEPQRMVLPKWMIQLAGLFNGNIRESVEMLYQNDSDYLFDSSKFDKAFNFPVTPYAQGIRETARSLHAGKP